MLVESGILGFGRQNTAQGIRNPLMIVIIHSAHYLFSDWPKSYGAFPKSAPETSSTIVAADYTIIMSRTLKVMGNHVTHV